MATTNEISQNDIVVGDGTTTIIPFQFNWDDKDNHIDIIVTSINTTTKVETVLVEGVDYNIILLDPFLMIYEPSILLAFPLAVGTNLLVERKISNIQSLDYQTNRPFPATTHERLVDRVFMSLSELKNLFKKVPKLSKFANSSLDLSLPEPEDGFYLAWDGTSGRLRNASTTIDPLLLNSQDMVHDPSDSTLTTTNVKTSIDALDVKAESLDVRVTSNEDDITDLTTDIATTTTSLTDLTNDFNDLSALVMPNVVTVNGSLTSNYNILSSDDVILCTGSPCSVTLPTAVGVAGKVYRIVHNGLNLNQFYTINTTSSQTVGGIASGAYTLYTNQEVLEVVSNGTNWTILKHFAETAWIDSGPTVITSTGTNPTKATGPARDKLFWKRAGTNVHIDMQYKAPNSTSGAANGTGTYLFNVPSGITFDTGITGGNTSTNIADFNRSYGTAVVSDSVGRPAMILVYSVNQFTLWGFSTGSNSYQSIGSTFFSIATNSIFYGANLILPASGWRP